MYGFRVCWPSLVYRNPRILVCGPPPSSSSSSLRWIIGLSLGFWAFSAYDRSEVAYSQELLGEVVALVAGAAAVAALVRQVRVSE